MRKLLVISVLLAGMLAAQAQVLVPVPGANGAVDPATGQFYPRVDRNAVLEPNSGHIIAVPEAPRQAHCPEIQRAARQLNAVLHGMDPDDPDYARLYDRYQALQQAQAEQCD